MKQIRRIRKDHEHSNKHKENQIRCEFNSLTLEIIGMIKTIRDLKWESKEDF